MNRDDTIDSGVGSLNDAELADVGGGGLRGVFVNPFGCDVAPPPEPPLLLKVLATVINNIL
jgi:hypothetical protein